MDILHRSPLQLLMAEFEGPFQEAAAETASGDPQEVAAACLRKATDKFRRRIQADVVGELGYWDSQYRVQVLEEAQRWANLGVPSFYVEVDLRNVGGVNAKRGHTGCNETLFIPVARILRDCLHEALAIPLLSAEAQRQKLQELMGGEFLRGDIHEIITDLRRGWIELFRHGGDEFSYIVVGVPERLLTALLDQAYRQVAEHEQREDLKFLPHPKHLFSFRKHWGISISYGIAEVSATLQPAQIFTTADKRVEEMKRSGRISYGRGTGDIAFPIRRYAPSDYPKLWVLALRCLLER